LVYPFLDKPVLQRKFGALFGVIQGRQTILPYGAFIVAPAVDDEGVFVEIGSPEVDATFRVANYRVTNEATEFRMEFLLGVMVPTIHTTSLAARRFDFGTATGAAGAAAGTSTTLLFA
jgi:hypothetical protein